MSLGGGFRGGTGYPGNNALRAQEHDERLLREADARREVAEAMRDDTSPRRSLLQKLRDRLRGPAR